MNWLDLIVWILVSVIILGRAEIKENKRIKSEIANGVYPQFIKRKRDIKTIYLWICFSIIWVVFFTILDYNVSDLLGIQKEITLFGIKIGL